MSEKSFYNNIRVGEEIPLLIKEPTLRTAVKWACASGDFHEIHYDYDYAEYAGLPGVIVHGGVIFSYISQMITDWVSQYGVIKKIGCSYRGLFFPGEPVICRAKVIKKYIENGEYRVECDTWAENPGGEKLATGKVVVTLF